MKDAYGSKNLGSDGAERKSHVALSAVPFIDQEENARKNLEDQLVSWFEEILGMRHVLVDQDFFILGGNSILGSRLLARVEEKYGFDIGILKLYDAPTATKLADLIQLKQSSAEHWCIVPIRPLGTSPPLFLIHGVGGNVLGFSNLAMRLSPDQPVYGVQAQALQPHGPILVDLKDMAAFYLGEVRRVQPAGPYHFVGLSYGGLVAYEMAQQLLVEGEEVRLLGMLDTWQPSYVRRVPGSASGLKRIYKRLCVIWGHIHKLRVSSKIKYVRNRMRSRVLRRIYQYRAARGKNNLTRRLNSVRDVNWIAGLNYQVRPYDGKVTLFRAMHEDADWNLPEDLGWRQMARAGVDVYVYPGDHSQVLAEPSVSHLAEKITECLLLRNCRIEIDI